MALFTFSRELDPVNALFRLQNELERVFQSPRGLEGGLLGRGVHPPVNLFRQDGDVVIRIEVPGFAPEDLSIESRGQTLSVGGKRSQEPAAEGAYHRRERVAGEFSRSIQLPRDVDPSQAAASCKHGVLTVRVPARAEVKPRQIAVTAQ
ncbi:MAG TPA: Hsp20/alpha crystallin family protein [Myxococcota bacterium]|nr:Hsp20/alpha crystallin family protein [Myxococcota bacterium]